MDILSLKNIKKLKGFTFNVIERGIHINNVVFVFYLKHKGK